MTVVCSLRHGAHDSVKAAPETTGSERRSRPLRRMCLMSIALAFGAHASMARAAEQYQLAVGDTVEISVAGVPEQP